MAATTIRHGLSHHFWGLWKVERLILNMQTKEVCLIIPSSTYLEKKKKYLKG